MSDDELVRMTRDGAVATITLDSPANRNAISAPLRRQLLGHLRAAMADESVRVVALTHTGTVFCSGMDLKESRQAAPTDQGVLELPAILEAIWNGPKPVVASLHGSARAGGIGLVAAADIAIAAETATFGLSEVRIGVVAALLSVLLVPRMTSRALNELMLTGEVFGAGRAAELGLINLAVPQDGVDAEAARYVDLLLLGEPSALAGSKKLLRDPPVGSFAEQLMAMARLSADFFARPAAQEGLRAFAEKRPPSWTTDLHHPPASYR